jgi:hypothetical protein
MGEPDFIKYRIEMFDRLKEKYDKEVAGILFIRSNTSQAT